jgi:hypothetical protein
MKNFSLVADSFRILALSLVLTAVSMVLWNLLEAPLASAQTCNPATDPSCPGPLPGPPGAPPGGVQNPQDDDEPGGVTNPQDDPQAGGTGGDAFTNPLQFNTLSEFLVAILNAVILIVFPFIVLLLVYAGFQFVVAQGKPEAISKAKNAFLWTLIGALVVLGAKALSIAICATVDEIQGQNSSVCG